MRIKRSKEWWKDHYDNWSASDLSIGAYANENENEINKSTFYGWIKKFRECDFISDDSTSTVQWATLNAPSSVNTTLVNKNISPINIIIGKATIKVKDNFNSEILNNVVKVLIQNA